MFIPWLVKEMLDLHYMRNIVLSVEAENRKSHRKTRAQPHRRTWRFQGAASSRVFVSRSFAFSLFKVECY